MSNNIGSFEWFKQGDEKNTIVWPENRTALMVARQIFYLTERARRAAEIAKSSPSKIAGIWREWESDVGQLCVSAFSKGGRVRRKRLMKLTGRE